MYKQQTKVREAGDNVESDVGDLKSEIAVLIEKVETYKMMLEEERQDKLDTLKLYEEVSLCCVLAFEKGVIFFFYFIFVFTRPMVGEF